MSSINRFFLCGDCRSKLYGVHISYFGEHFHKCQSLVRRQPRHHIFNSDNNGLYHTSVSLFGCVYFSPLFCHESRSRCTMHDAPASYFFLFSAAAKSHCLTTNMAQNSSSWFRVARNHKLIYICSLVWWLLCVLLIAYARHNRDIASNVDDRMRGAYASFTDQEIIINKWKKKKKNTGAHTETGKS